MMTIDELSKLMKEGFEALNKRLDDIDTRLCSVETDVAWIKARLKGDKKAERVSGR